MQAPIRISILLATSCLLAGCNTGGRQGVFEPTSVAPPPSVAGGAAVQAAPVAVSSSRRAVAVPESVGERAVEPEPAVQPVLTGRGLGAGVRF
jgi:hypothetical protein